MRSAMHHRHEHLLTHLLTLTLSQLVKQFLSRVSHPLQSTIHQLTKFHLHMEKHLRNVLDKMIQKTNSHPVRMRINQTLSVNQNNLVIVLS